MGIRLGLVGVFFLLIALVWSGIRVLRIDRTLHGVMMETAKTTSLVFIILLGAAMLTAAFRAFGGEELVRDFLNGLPGGFWTQFVIVMAVIFVLGFFLDFIEIAVVVVPIVAPILLADPSANITAVWLGVMIGLNIQTSFLTPPFGFALFYLRGVAPAVVKTVSMYKGVILFIGLQLSALAIVGLYPPLVNYLPNRVSFLSETAPPPRNPKLQYCVEEFVGEKLAADASIREAIEGTANINISALPSDLQDDLSDGFESAKGALVSLQAAFDAEVAVGGAADVYRPQQIVVRQIEKKIRKVDEEVEDLNKRIGRMRTDDVAEARVRLEERRDGMLAEIEEFRTEIPDTWEAVHDEFATLTEAEQKARNTYRRQADDAWDAPIEVLNVLDSNADFAALEGRLRDMRSFIETTPEADAHETVNELSKVFGDVEGAGDIKSALSKARRALRNRNPDREKALEEYEEALAIYEEQAEWRSEADASLRAPLNAYMDKIRGTLGMRSQDDLTREQGLFLASCNAVHRDISLNF